MRNSLGFANPSMFGKVAVMMGGRSAEREVSLKSGAMVLSALRAAGVDAHGFDPARRALDDLARESFARVFIALHGRHGEDGVMQGALELRGIPYTGSGVLASALAMDKMRTKMVWIGAGVQTPAWEQLSETSDAQALVLRLGLPIMVKPASEGSSIGMSKVRREQDIAGAYALAASHDKSVIAEQFIEGTELTAGILEDSPLPLIRLETPRDFYDYEAKYVANDTRYILPCGLPAASESALQAESLRAYLLLGCRGWGRVDLILDREGKPYFLEVNTSPGMTDHSLVPMAARHLGLSFGELCLRILVLAGLEAGDWGAGGSGAGIGGNHAGEPSKQPRGGAHVG
ncbi:MAG: D-alanine--D-alanine ligase [Betaproteobacteria bacterium]|nr:D-alanine--D-alanine ligase [Betaproteobacteria bacterium]